MNHYIIHRWWLSMTLAIPNSKILLRVRRNRQPSYPQTTRSFSDETINFQGCWQPFPRVVFWDNLLSIRKPGHTSLQMFERPQRQSGNCIPHSTLRGKPSVIHINQHEQCQASFPAQFSSENHHHWAHEPRCQGSYLQSSPSTWAEQSYLVIDVIRRFPFKEIGGTSCAEQWLGLPEQ